MLRGWVADKVATRAIPWRRWTLNLMDNRRNYYRILHVEPDAPAETIRLSYRTLMHKLKMHPDLGGDHWNAALINEAFDTLGNPRRRASYDKLMNGLRERQPIHDQTARPGCLFCGNPYDDRSADSPQALCNRCQSPL